MEFGTYNTNQADSNQIFPAYPLDIHNPAFNEDALRDISEAQTSGNLSRLCEAFKLFYNQGMAYANGKDKTNWPAYRSYLRDDTSLAVTDEYIRDNLVVYNEYTAEPTQFMIENEPAAKKLFGAMAEGLISGVLDADEYDKFIAQWDSLYGNTAPKEVNDWYKSKNR